MSCIPRKPRLPGVDTLSGDSLRAQQELELAKLVVIYPGLHMPGYTLHLARGSELVLKSACYALHAVSSVLLASNIYRHNSRYLSDLSPRAMFDLYYDNRLEDEADDGEWSSDSGRYVIYYPLSVLKLSLVATDPPRLGDYVVSHSLLFTECHLHRLSLARFLECYESAR